MKEMQAANHRKVHLSDIVSKSPIEWPKKALDWEDAVKDAAVICEDQESPRERDEIRITLMPKRHVRSLLDLRVAERGIRSARACTAALSASSRLVHKIRSGKAPKTKDEAAG